MPRGAGKWCNDAAQRYLPFTIASQFQRLGIQPLAYHNGNYTYYDRHKMFPGFGFDYKARGGGLEMTGSWNASDLEMIELTIDEFINKERFYVHYMTLSGHSVYSLTNNPIARKNRDAVEHLPFSDNVKAYLACQLELEYAMTYLLERLEAAGIADRTVIVMTSDHYPYGLTHPEIEELAGGTLEKNVDLHHNVGIIYAKGMTPEVVSEPAYVPDMVPTVLNLLGLPFDSRFLTGRDVFSDAKPLVMLGNSFRTNLGTRRNSFAANEGVEIPEGYVRWVQDVMAAERDAVSQIVRLNYFESIREYIESS
jgi:phosphoglycerol transferase MdoB-like AlkP superfamily enzyme